MPARSSTWISTGFEQLRHRCRGGEARFDIVIIGSGYGAAVAAAELAGCGERGKALSVCVLERGEEYLPGMFPSRMADLPGHIRASTGGSAAPQGQRHGLFDFRLGADVNALVANGLGGGSLINAGVMATPRAAVFERGWPEAIKNDDQLLDYYRRAGQLLGAADSGGDNTVERHSAQQRQPLHKYSALKQLAGGDAEATFRAAPITVAMRDGYNSAGVALKACSFCGDCATGCNHGAKDSLDTNLLVTAKRRGAQIFTGATVLRIEKGDGDWLVHTTATSDKLRQSQPQPLPVRAARVVLAAGTFGSTEILMRSSSPSLRFSKRLGQGFSTNGDMIAAGYDHRTNVNAVAREDRAPAQRRVGPTITAMVDYPNQSGGLLLEEMAVPAAMRRFFEEIVTTANTLQQLAHIDSGEHESGPADADPYAVSQQAIDRSAIYAVMGDDGAEGALELVAGGGRDNDGDGAICVRWPDIGRQALFDRQIELLQQRAAASGLGGTIIPNPLWRLLPKSMTFLFGEQVGPVLTVHPLGGCAMADNRERGVVDHLGRVYNAAATCAEDRFHEGLVVLDGSVVPTALGANPALTIAALALRAVEALRDQVWQLQQPGGGDRACARESRPVFTAVDGAAGSEPQQEPYQDTKIQITERVSGRAALTASNGALLPCVVDITLSFDPHSALALARGPERRLNVDRQRGGEAASRLRIFHRDDWQQLKNRGADEASFNRAALMVAPVSGTLTLCHRAATAASQRQRRALWAWLFNRGMRDSWQALVDYLKVGRHLRSGGSSSVATRLRRKIHEMRALASRAGEVRLLQYDLQVLQPPQGWPQALGGFSAQAGEMAIRAEKRITYGRRSNPLQQLENLWLLDFPALQPPRRQIGRRPPQLKYDATFMARHHQPLLRIAAQRDQTAALADVASFLAYFARLLIGIHAWTFRKPDTPPLRQPSRLPADIPGLPPPQITELELGRSDNGIPIRIRLSRYPRRASRHPPLLLLHGYSASGTTFTHAALRPGAARYFWRQQRDVWVLDMRTSSGMLTAWLPWTFEQVGRADIPVAVDYIFRHTGRRCDVIAHCMGAAMFSIAVLSPPRCGEPYYRQRLALPQRINKVVLSQVGPSVVFTPANIYRAYTLNYLRHLLPGIFYSFRAAADESLPMQLLDRLLAALPYPPEEFDLENPPWFWQRRPFVSTRHRVDGLYGRCFNLQNMPAGVLAHIDDIFGPMNMETLGQVIHFALREKITNRAGRNEFVTRENLQKYWRFATLSVHGEENGLADTATLTRMRQTFAAAGLPLHTEMLAGFGHQDALIGAGAEKNFDKIRRFLEAPETDFSAPAADVPAPLTCELPYSGPIISAAFERGGSDYISVGMGTSPELGNPELIAFVAVNAGEAGLRPVFGGGLGPQAPGLCLKLARGAADNWYKVALPVTAEGRAADGYLVFFVYDRDIEPSELTYDEEQLPDNLLDLIKPPAETDSDNHLSGCTPLSNYLAQIFASGRLSWALDAALQQSPALLRAALVEIPAAVTDMQDCSFVFGSCQYPAGMLDEGVAFASYRRLSQRLDRAAAGTKPGLALLMGDQIYADPTAGLFDPTDKDDRYIRSYHKWLRNHHVKMVLRRLPSCMMLDDHEIKNDWDSGEAGDHADFAVDGCAAYLNFQRHIHQPAAAPCGDAELPLWYQFSHAGLPFFMADTRTERQRRTADNIDRARIFSEAQYEHLTRWLLQWQARAPSKPKFIVSPSMLLPRRLHSAAALAHALRSDAWDGYPYSLQRLLAFICDREIDNLVFLSGDEHLSSVAQITLSERRSGRQVRLHSVHSSGFYIPMPFVNTRPADLAGCESFDFVPPGGRGEYRCQVDTRFVPGAGFAQMQVARRDDQYQLSCEFDRATGTQTFTLTLTNKVDTESCL